MRTGAAYSLGGCASDTALATLGAALGAEENESARRAGALGLGAAGDRAVPTLLRVLQTPGISGLVAGSAVEALGEVSRHDLAGIWVAVFSRCGGCRCAQAAMSPDATVISALDATCRAQHSVIAAAEASAEVAADELPVFTEQNVHVNGDLRVAVMLPVACRPVRRLLCLCLSASLSVSVLL